MGNNSASFTTKFVESSMYRRSVKRDDIAPFLMFTQPTPEFNYLQKIKQLVKWPDNTPVNVYKYGQVTTFLAHLMPKVTNFVNFSATSSRPPP